MSTGSNQPDILSEILAASDERPGHEPICHLTFQGRSHEIALAVLDVGNASSDQEVKTAVARHFSVPVTKLDDFRVVHEPNGNMTVRPEAGFGA